MTLTEIENLSHADLKAKRDELIAAASEAEKPELAARYVKARTDAKARDDKLAEQGRTIDALTSGNESLTRRVSDLETQLASAKAGITSYAAELEAAHKAHSDEVATLNQKIAAAAEQLRTVQQESAAALSAVTQERDAAVSLAKARRSALADVMQHANGLTAKVAPLLADEG